MQQWQQRQRQIAQQRAAQVERQRQVQQEQQRQIQQERPRPSEQALQAGRERRPPEDRQRPSQQEAHRPVQEQARDTPPRAPGLEPPHIRAPQETRGPQPVQQNAQRRPEPPRAAPQASLAPVHAQRQPPASRVVSATPIRINPSTTAVVRPVNRALTLRRNAPGGAQVVMDRPYVHSRPVVASAYLVKRTAEGGRVRTYLDGRRILFARNGDVSHVSRRGLTVTAHRNGLTQASTGGGRPVYQESFRPAPSGRGQVVVRREFGHVVAAPRGVPSHAADADLSRAELPGISCAGVRARRVQGRVLERAAAGGGL